MSSIVNRGGRYRALVRRDGTTRCKTFGSRREAEAWAARIEREIGEIAATGFREARSMTIADVIDGYVSPNSTTTSILRVARKEIGRNKAASLTLDGLLRWVELRVKRGATVATAVVYISTLGRVFRSARLVQRIDLPLAIFGEARAALRATGQRTKPRVRDRIPTDDELARLIATAETRREGSLPLADLIRVASITACRRSELCNLKVSDFDPDARTLRVRQRKSPTPEKLDSVIPCFEPAYSVLIRHTEGKKSTDRIFDCEPRSVTRAFTGVARGAGLGDIVFHSLRHRACTKLLSAGLTIPEAALVSGHRDWGSLRRYTHLTAEHVASRAKALGLE